MLRELMTVISGTFILLNVNLLVYYFSSSKESFRTEENRFYVGAVQIAQISVEFMIVFLFSGIIKKRLWQTRKRSPMVR